MLHLQTSTTHPMHCPHSPVTWTLQLEPVDSIPIASNPTTTRVARTYRGKPIACTACRRLKIKCRREPGHSGCLACRNARLPRFLCTSETVQRIQPFEKWSNKSYKSLFVDVGSSWKGDTKTVQLRHYLDGPTIAVICREFVPSSKHQFHVSKLDAGGWHTVKTTAYGVYVKVDIALYVKRCVDLAIRDGCEDRRTAAFFELAKHFRDHALIAQCLELYTALHIMRNGCQFAGDETLGMTPIDDPQSAWHMHSPVPRMIQNELCHELEMHMIELDKRCLKEVEAIMRCSSHSKWLIGTLATFLLLHTREVDIGRNIHWNRYKDSFGFWIHPSKPVVLIEKSVASCNSLLFAYHSSLTNAPTTLNWDLSQNQDLVGKDIAQILALKALQSYIIFLRQERMIGCDPVEVYQVGQPNSLTLTISSLMFVDKGRAKASRIW